MRDEHVDSKGNAITVGAKVRVGIPGDDEVAEVIQITDSDGDVDDEGRGVFYPPRIVVKLANGETDNFITHSTATGPWDLDDSPFQCDDVEVIG